MSLRTVLAALAFWLATVPPVLSHEFWVEPEEYQAESGAPLVAHLRNGENFKGSSLAYFEKRTARFELRLGGDVQPVTARMGDIPALQTAAPGDGLLVIVHETEPSTLKYTEWAKFAKFAEHKDFADIRARHDARGLPESGFTESYRRFAKALVAVGSGAGADAPTGMETEFVALTNPYAGAPGDAVEVQLFYQDAPRNDAQVEVFDKTADGTVTITYLRTDQAGRVTVPVTSGHQYLLDGVVLRPAPEGGAAVWETLWAALTFAVP